MSHFHPRVVRHESDLGRWEAVYGEPDPRLRAYVLSYQGFRESGTRFERRRELPTGLVTLIINFDSTVRVHDPRGTAPAADHSGIWIAGIDDTYAITELGPHWQGLQVDFTPIGARRFLGLPMSEIARRIVALQDLLGPSATDWAERLQAAPDWEERFSLLEGFLLRRLTDALPPSESMLWAWNRLRRADGNLRIASLTGELGISRKALNARFRDQIGLSPKLLARISRFQHALRLLEGNAAPRWTDVAYDCGYYDQAHMIRDFRQFCGSSPTELVQCRLPDGAGIVADSGIVADD